MSKRQWLADLDVTVSKVLIVVEVRTTKSGGFDLKLQLCRSGVIESDDILKSVELFSRRRNHDQRVVPIASLWARTALMRWLCGPLLQEALTKVLRVLRAYGLQRIAVLAPSSNLLGSFFLIQAVLSQTISSQRIVA